MKLLVKTIQIIDLLKKHPKGLPLSRIAQELGYPQSTVHRILQTLSTQDYIVQYRESRKYALGFEFLRIGKSILENLELREVAHAHLLRLHEQCGETTHLYILQNLQLTVIDMIPKRDGLSLASYIGWTTDPYPSAAGKILLSELSQSKIRAMYRDKPLKNSGKNAITDIGVLVQAVQEAGARGYAIDDEEFYEGGRCVAAPVRSGKHGPIEAAISVTGTIFDITMERIRNELLGMVTETAERVSANLMRW